MSTRYRRISLALPMVLALVVGGCGQGAPVTSFDPASACTTDGRMPGAYPDLEALLPTSYEGKPPATVDSGRSCTADQLGTLAASGIAGLRFAGATWPLGGTSGLTVAVFEGDGLEPAEMIRFYEDGARTASRTDKLKTSETTVGALPAKRLDVLRSDGSGQSILAWPDGEDRVMVLLAADLGDARVAEAAEAFATP